MLEHEQLEHIQNKLKKALTEKRYRHTIGVQYTSVALAMCYEEDLQKAALAGLLHDCAKCLKTEEMLKECHRYDVVCSKTEKEQTQLIHAKLGAVYAKEKYGIQDPQILSAIRWHTTGKEDMSLLEKIVFTADYIEPHRKMLPVLPKIRRLAFTDLDEAVYSILDATLDYLQEDSKSQDIEEHSMQAFAYYKKLHDDKMHRNKFVPSGRARGKYDVGRYLP